MSRDIRAPKRRIFVLSTDPWLNRLHGASILTIFKSLADQGYEIVILVPHNRNKLVIENPMLIIKCIKVRRWIPLISLIFLYKSYLKVLKIIFKKGSTVIFDHPMLPLFLVTKILWKSKGVMLNLSRPVAERGFHGWVQSLNFRFSLMLGKHFVSMFTAISPFEAMEFSRIGRIPRHMIVVLPSPLGKEFENFNYCRDKNELRIKLGLKMLLGKKVLLYHGVLDVCRGIMDILRSFTESFKEDEEIVLLIVGDGPAKDSIKNFILTNKLKNVILYGPVPYSKMPQVIASCDIGLVLFPDHPWWRYQCPTKLIEFLALGKPVVASDLPGIRWIASNSPLITYVKTFQSKELGNAIKLALAKTYSVTDNIRTKYYERFSSVNIAQKLKSIIEAIS